MDLRFPHHENEIAQAEAATGKAFAKYWMHIGLLTINGKKMSKSIGNILNVRDLLSIWDSEIIRMFLAQAHYRSPPDYSEKALTDIEKGLERLYRVKERLEEHARHASKKKIVATKLNDAEKRYMTAISKFQDEFEQAMDDDFNTPKAFAVLFEFVNTSNKFFEQQSQPNAELCKHALGIYCSVGSVLTLFQPKTVQQKKEEPDLINKLQSLLQSYGKPLKSTQSDELVRAVLQLREDARKRKDWKIADDIRKHLEQLEIEIQDTVQGPVWRKK
jgi:cysteinyl-tRNA synthetase